MADTAVETAPADENDDNWLYGDSTAENVQEGDTERNEKSQETPDATDRIGNAEDKEQEENDGNEDSQFNDEHFQDVDREDQDQTNGDVDSQGNGDSDSDDSDHVKVTIGEIKSGPQTYASLNVKRGVGLVTTGPGEKPRPGPTTSGKVNLEDLEGPGSINGVPALEFNIDTIEDKPWNKPGADISDYFNYGFNEVTWSAYCDRQRRMRVSEAGVGLHATPRAAPPPDLRRPPVRPDDGMQQQMAVNFQTRENTIQVMTAERREWGRGALARDGPEYFAPHDHFYPPHATHPPYDEPWPQTRHPEQGGWAPTEIKELTPGPPSMGPPMLPPPHMAHVAPHLPPYRPHVPHTPHPQHVLPPHALDRERERDRDRERERDRERDRMREREERDRRDRDRRDDEERDRDRDRDRSRSIKPERIRDKTYRRERSRSRSRRHKSRSRSPRPRDRSRERDRAERERSRDRDRERPVKTKTKESKEKDDEK